MNESGIIGRLLVLGMASFYLEIALATLIVSANAKKRKLFPLRVLLYLAFATPFYWLPSLNAGGYNFSYLMAFLTAWGLSYFLYDDGFFQPIFSAVAAWGLQHIAWNVLGIVYDLIPSVASLSDAVLYVIFIAVYVVLYLLSYFLIRKAKLHITYQKNQLFSFVVASIIIAVTAILSQFVHPWTIVGRIYSALLATLALMIQFGYPYLDQMARKQKELEDEKTTLEKMIQLQAQQETLSKETMDAMNRKFHDLKNQLLVIEREKGTLDPKSMEELKKNLDTYQAFYHTGNNALDILLTQKALLAQSKGIRVSYIVEGKAFSSLLESDLVSLFGNVLDNSIEATSKEKEEKRLIKLWAVEKNGLLLLKEENPSSTKLSFENGLPVSTKNDPLFHGFGMKSLSYLVEKYKGEMNVKQEDGWFFLSIVLPEDKVDTASGSVKV